MPARLMTWVGGLGAGVTALCCFTGLLPLTLGIVGLGGLTGYVYRDDVLYPILAVFLILLGAGLWISKKHR